MKRSHFAEPAGPVRQHVKKSEPCVGRTDVAGKDHRLAPATRVKRSVDIGRILHHLEFWFPVPVPPTPLMTLVTCAA